MTLWTPPGPCFQGIVSNFTGRPGLGFGTTHTSGVSNSKAAAYTEILAGASLTFDAYAFEIIVSGVMKAADNSQCLMDIGIDNAAGGSYTELVNNLQVSNATYMDGGDSAGGSIGGISYYFPLFIPAGTQIGVRAQTNDNTAVTTIAYIKLYGLPKYPELARAGSYCDTFGALTASSLGTAITPGTTDEGAWADINGADTTKPYWYWEYGMGIADTTTAAIRIYCADLGVGDASNKFVVRLDEQWGGGDNECLTRRSHPGAGYYEAPVGVRPYVRAQSSAALETNYTSCVYAVGG